MAVCYPESLQIQQLPVPTPQEMEAIFFCLLADNSAVLLCALNRPQWQGGTPFTFLTEQLDTIMDTQNCQNTVVVGHMNHHLVHRAFMELTVVHGLTNHVNFTTHVRGASLDPVPTDLPGDSVLCSQVNRVSSSNHNAVLCTL